jgi:NTE family protein
MLNRRRDRGLRSAHEPDGAAASLLDAVPAAGRPSTGRRTTAPRTVLVIACIGVFMSFLDETVVGIAFPDLLRSFPEASLGGLSWVLNAYNIAFAALLVPAGRYADVLGRRRLFVAGLILFTSASAACAGAPSVEALVGARALQGAGAAAIVPASLALLLEAYPVGKRGQAIALWAATAALAAGIGPSIGGFLVELRDWRLVFLVNIPIGIVAVRVAGRWLVESRAPGRRAYPDLRGAFVLALAVGLLTLALVQTDGWGWLSAGVALAAAGSIAATALLVRRNRRHPSPVLDPALIREPGFAATGAISLVGSAGFFGLGLANLLFLMQVWGYSPLVAGLAVTPAPFAAAVTAGLVGKLASGRDARPLVLVGGLVWAAGPLVLLARMDQQPDYLGAYLPAALLLAIGVGIAFPLVSDAAVSAAPGERYAGATALNGALRQIGAALGIAVIAALVGHDAVLQVTDGFHRAWIFSSACFLFVALGALRLPPFQPLALVAEEAPASDPPPAASTARSRRPSGPTPAAAPLPRTAAELLPQVALFSGLERGLLEMLEADMTTVIVPAGHWLFRRGDDADALYIVLSGRLEVVAEGDRVISELSSGDVVGELALLAEAPRSTGIRARRDARLLRLARETFDAMMQRPAFAKSVTRVLGAELQRVERPDRGRGARPSTTAVLAVGVRSASLRLPERLAAAMSALTPVAYLGSHSVGGGVHDTGPRLAEALDRLEREHDHVVLSAGTLPDDESYPWTRACLDQADRVLLVLAPTLPPIELPALQRGCEAVLHDCAGDPEVAALLGALDPRTTYRLASGREQQGDLGRLARRLVGRSVGLVLSGGGARSFAQLGAIEELQAAGVVIDRVGGVSMGAFIGALLAQGMSADEVDARCYEEWVRQRPLSDYRVPRVSLVRGARARAMLERNLPGAIEDLPLSFYCVSTDMIGAQLVVHRRGPLAISVGGSMCVPGLVPPVELDGRLLVDGGVLDYLPVATMADQAEGPIIACDTSEHEVRALPSGPPPLPPSLPETLYKLVLIGSADPKVAGQRADVLIRPDCDGTGLLEFHMIDRMREAGRRAAYTALESAPETLF